MSDVCTSARGFDFHCHVDLLPDPAQAVASCERDRVMTLAVTTTPKAWPQNRQWTAGKSYVHAAVGLHPELVADRHEEVGLLENYICESRLVGEIGLDGSPQYRKSRDLQVNVFVRALRRAQDLGGRVLSIHSRRAVDDVVRLLGENTSPEDVLPILHWFSGSAAAARKAVGLGCYFSVNQRMLEHDAGLALVRKLPHERLLTETDAPFGGQRNQPPGPSDALMTAENLASVLGMEPAALHRILSENSVRVLSFAGIEVTRTRAGVETE